MGSDPWLCLFAMCMSSWVKYWPRRSLDCFNWAVCCVLSLNLSLQVLENLSCVSSSQWFLLRQAHSETQLWPIQIMTKIQLRSKFQAKRTNKKENHCRKSQLHVEFPIFWSFKKFISFLEKTSCPVSIPFSFGLSLASIPAVANFSINCRLNVLCLPEKCTTSFRFCQSCCDMSLRKCQWIGDEANSWDGAECAGWFS